ncbi:MAG: sugar ABC transporter substrate-binding protein [Paracoccaceae bacterium]|jgi:ribose transport system substrate-binding protein|tara:strand:- start:28 stop:1053 length:1026 start_codon:yes stop_codon:yes gene_type:complete
MSYFTKLAGVALAGGIAISSMATSAFAASIISFNGPAGEAYIGKFIKGIKNTAELKGFDIKVYENQFNQAEQDQQVQQVLAAGQLPDVFIWWPSDAVAGLGSLRALAKTGVPVLKINQLPNEQDKQYIFGYAGPDDRLRARNAGYMMREAAAAKKAAGGAGFNVLVLSYPHSYGGYGLSINAFNEAIAGSDLKIIGDVDEGFGQANGYKGAAKMIAALQGQSIDFVYGMDDAILTGGIKALEEAGMVMGEDVIAVGTVCNGDKQLIEEGKQFGTTLQSPLHEGQLAIKMVEEYLNTGKLANYINFTPNPSVTKDTIETTALRGYDGKLYTIEELCSGAWGG